MIHRTGLSLVLLASIFILVLNGQARTPQFTRLDPATTPVWTSSGMGGKEHLSSRDTIWIGLANFEAYPGEIDPLPMTSADLTENGSHWHITTVGADLFTPTPPAGNRAWRCGYVLDDLATPVSSYYGNNWSESLVLSDTIPTPVDPEGKGFKAQISARIEFDIYSDYEKCEDVDGDGNPDCDLIEITHRTGDEEEEIQIVQHPESTGGSTVGYDFTFESTGDNTPLFLTFRFKTDEFWDNDDGLPTTSPGGVWLDNIKLFIERDGGYELHQGHVETCEPGSDLEWGGVSDIPVGNFGHLDGSSFYEHFGNLTQIATFIDDPFVGPGWGTPGITWTYGPGGYVLNPSGGLAGPFGNGINNSRMWNEMQSDPVSLPASRSGRGVIVKYQAMVHEPLLDESPGMFHTLRVRSTSSSVEDDIYEQPWQSRDVLYYGDPGWRDFNSQVGDLVVPDAQHMQVAVGVRQLGYLWGWEGADATPGPFLDNILIGVYPLDGPLISAHEADLAQDSTPNRSSVDYFTLQNNHVPVDQARIIGPGTSIRPQFGDSLVVKVAAMTPGTEITNVKLHYLLQPKNSLFDTHVIYDLEGDIPGQPVYVNLRRDPDKFFFDVPDSNFMYPGFQMHYFIEASDSQGLVATLPGDTTGFHSFAVPGVYPEAFTMRAFPSINSSTTGDHPPILVWDDGGERSGVGPCSLPSNSWVITWAGSTISSGPTARRPPWVTGWMAWPGCPRSITTRPSSTTGATCLASPGAAMSTGMRSPTTPA
jgi:hypothetical protein